MTDDDFRALEARLIAAGIEPNLEQDLKDLELEHLLREATIEPSEVMRMILSGEIKADPDVIPFLEGTFGVMASGVSGAMTAADTFLQGISRRA